MNHKAIYPKVATDLFWIQFFWSLGFLGVMFMIHVIKIIIHVINDTGVNYYFSAIYTSSNIFMLVIGIISVYGFLGHYIGNGVTRNDYFKGAVLSTIGLSFAIPVIASVISLIEHWLIRLTQWYTVENNPFSNRSSGEDNNVIGDIIESVVISPFIDLQSNWLLAILIFALNLLTYFVAGWIISATFYRFGVLIGLGSIVLALVILIASDGLLSAALGLPVFEMLAPLPLSLPISILGVLVILGIALWIIRLMTRRVAVKM